MNNKPNLTSLNKQDMDRLKMVVRSEPNFMDIPSMDLLDVLDERYKNKGTFSVMAYTLKKFFEEIGENKKSEFWGAAGKELSKLVYDEESDNKLTNNEKKNWKNQEDIIDILNSIVIKDRTDYNRFLLLSMTTFQPPLRKSFYQSVKFATSVKQLNTTDNFVLLDKKCHYIVNTDKVSKFDKFKEDDQKYIEISSPDLCKLLRDSYNQDPRTYVFEKDDGKPYSINSISIVLLERPFGLSFNILRSSYVSNFYNKNQDLKSRQKLATKMRHSADVAQLNYFKTG